MNINRNYLEFKGKLVDLLNEYLPTIPVCFWADGVRHQLRELDDLARQLAAQEEVEGENEGAKEPETAEEDILDDT